MKQYPMTMSDDASRRMRKGYRVAGSVGFNPITGEAEFHAYNQGSRQPKGHKSVMRLPHGTATVNDMEATLRLRVPATCFDDPEQVLRRESQLAAEFVKHVNKL